MPYLVGFITPQDYGAAGNGVADDTAAIQAALNACPAGSGVYFPAGTYQVSAPLTVAVAGCRLLGAHSANSGFEGGNGIGSVINAASGFTGAEIIFSNGMADFSMRDVTVRGFNLASGTVIGINATSSIVLEDVLVSYMPGDGIHLSGGTSWMRNVGVFHAGNNTGTGNGFVINEADSGYIGCLASGCATAGWSITRANNSTFTACRAEDSTGVGSYGYYYSDNAVLGGVSFNQCSTDKNYGDGFHFAGLAGNGAVQLNGCQIRRDGNAAAAGSTTYAGIRITGCTLPIVIDGTTVTARQGDAGGADSPHYGISIDTSSYASVQGGYYSTDATTGAQPYHWDGAGTFLVGPGIPTATVSAGVPTLITPTASGPNPNPSDQNLKAWSYDPGLQTSSTTLTSGLVYLIRMPLAQPQWITNILIEVMAAGTGLTSGQNFVGLYSSGGTLIATSADQTSAWGSTGLKSAALTGAPYYEQGGFVYAAVLSTGTTPITVGRATVQGSATVNAGLTAAASRYATGPSGQTSLPGAITMSTLTPIATAIWVGAS